jgi:L-arabinose transport system permease protein
MTTTPTTPPTLDASARFARANRIRQIWDSAGMLLLFFALLIICSLTIRFFFTVKNFQSLALSVTTVGIISCTMLFCLAAGDFDLSVGSVAALGGVVAAIVDQHSHSALLGIIAGVASGGIVGFINGFVIAQLGINALIVTLATMQIARGIALICSDGKSIGISDVTLAHLGSKLIYNLEPPVWIMIACFIFFGLLLHRTVFGRNTLAIGGNKEAAKLAGISVTRIKIVIFTMQGLIAALAGVIVAAQTHNGDPKASQGKELDVIAACVLGGVSLTGGVGTILAVIVGTLIMGTVVDAMGLKNIDAFYQYVISGLILMAAVLLDKLKQRRSA